MVVLIIVVVVVLVLLVIAAAGAGIGRFGQASEDQMKARLPGPGVDVNRDFKRPPDEGGLL